MNRAAMLAPGAVHSTYKGCNICRMGRSSWGGRWEAYAGESFVRADTLAGIRGQITEALEESI